jgi:hypothetical protein
MNTRLLEAIAIVLILGLIIWLEPGFVLIAALVSLPYLIFLILMDMDTVEAWLENRLHLHQHHK